MSSTEPAPSAADLRAALLPPLLDAGWTADPRAWGLATREHLSLTVDDGRLSLDDTQGYPINVLDARVGSVGEAVTYLRAAGALPTEPQYTPALPHGGQSSAWVHGCGHMEPWPTDPDYLAAEGPITRQGCDACESGPDGSWRQLFVRVTP